MALRALNPDNALMFGSDDDRFYMADYPQEVDNILLSDEPDPSKFTSAGSRKTASTKPTTIPAPRSRVTRDTPSSRLLLRVPRLASS